MTEMVKKITSRSVGCEKKPGEGFIVIGKCMRMQRAETDKGEYMRFGGLFEAQNIVTGQLVRSATLIVPGVVEEMVASAVHLALAEDEHATVEIAFKFYTHEDKSAVIGYFWKADQLVEPFTTDPLADLRKLLPKPKTP